ncbi:MAG: transcriptional regulator [Acidimicrobiia bacterium]|nr:transcriptional regulator [Acidimicrobiia bacterium]
MSAGRLRLLTLHGLRLVGLATPEAVAEIHDLDPAAVGEELHRQSVEGLVSPARGDGGRWTLTGPGRRHGEELLGRELVAAVAEDGTPGRSVVTAVYHRFLQLNQPMLAVCTNWQIVNRDPIELNDHSDPDHDNAVIAALGDIDDSIQPLCAELESMLTRFRRYRPGFTEALHRLRIGETDWLTKPTILSYHTLWFQLHEDLLATLGLERAAETARLNGNPTSDRPKGTPETNPGIRLEPRACRPHPRQSDSQLTDIPLTDRRKDSS